MGLFRKETIEVGNIKKNESIDVKWEFDELRRRDIATYADERNEIHYAIDKSCSCQGALEVSDSGIKLRYNDQGHQGRHEKQITVYLADPNKPTKIKNHKGVEDFNPELGYIVLRFYVNVN